MNRIKRICTVLLTCLMAIVLMLSAVPELSIGGAYAEKAEKAEENGAAENNAEIMTATDAPVSYIYFDLAAGDVTIGATYTGYVFVNDMVGPQLVTGTHKTENKYYVYQSTEANRATTGYQTEAEYLANKGKNCAVPTYSRVAHDGKSWTDYITNNTNVEEVSRAWEIAAEAVDRKPLGAQATATGNRIIFDNASDYEADVTIDNIWTYYQVNGNSRTTGGITAHLKNSTDTKIHIRLKGDNRFGNVHYGAIEGSRNQIIFSNGDSESAPGSITVADFPKDLGRNYWCSAIGGDDAICDKSDGIVIESGVIYAGTTAADNCTALGGGGNEYGRVTINGGKVTAVAATTGTAIGGGIGWNGAGGNADVTITNGEVYAYNFGVDNSTSNKFEHYVPAVAIGGGSSQNSDGNAHTTVTIDGGFVYAQCMGGAAIGGGGSAKQKGGGATININGGTVIAKSTNGTFKGTLDPDVVDIPAGVSIGGGTGLLGGGSVVLNIDQANPEIPTILRTGSIGGGKTTGSGNIGNAKVTVLGGDIVGQIIMAGGATNPCSFTMEDGWIHGTDVINGNTVEEKYHDPRPNVKIQYSEINGGAVYMNDPQGGATISGGVIEMCHAKNGGAIYMAGGTCNLSGKGGIGANTADENGGAIYVEKGTVNISGDGHLDHNKAKNGAGMYVGAGKINISGGDICENVASENGGGMYIGGGDVDVTGGSIWGNTAAGKGGGAYIGGNFSMTAGDISENSATDGGGVYINDGIVTMYGGAVDSNKATESGGGMYISSVTKAALVDIFSGSVSNNEAKIGAGVSVVSGEHNAQPINVTVGVDCYHPDLKTNTRDYTAFQYDKETSFGEAHNGHTNHISGLTHETCPQVKGNVATERGGGFYLQSNDQTNLVFYCVIEGGNLAHGNKQCYDMDVQGGHVIIGDTSYDPNVTEHAKGNIVMEGSIWVEGGTVDIYGEMNNPYFGDEITVDIKKEQDHYIDHRVSNDPSITYYKVHYYENFKGDGDIPTGLYIANQYPDKDHINAGGVPDYNFTVKSSIFSHEGYKIVGWNTDPNNGSGGTWFEVNQPYDLHELDTDGVVGTETDPHLLVLYAIWECNVYQLGFDVNAPVGVAYSGEMPNQSVTVGILNGTQKINKNLFKCTGCEFVGWSLKAKPTESDTIYADEWTITANFTIEDAALITLYAQWKPCTHIKFLAYTVKGAVLTESCSNCGQHSATATVSAVNCNYDGNEHLATVTFSQSWLGDKSDPSYILAADTVWDPQDKIDDNWTADSKPVHAGNYTVKLTVKDVTAQVEFTIARIKWNTPEVPQNIHFKIGADGKSIVVIGAPTGSNISYRVTYLKDGVETAVAGHSDWQASNEFTGIPFGFYYYFYAKMSADRDHIESTPSRSEAYLADGGNIVFFQSANGILVEPETGDGTFKYVVTAQAGYHLRGYSDNVNSGDALTNAKPVEGAETKAYNNDGIQIEKQEVGKDKEYKYTVTFTENKVAFYQITLKFDGAVPNAKATHKTTDGEQFSDFNDKETTISRDSAFTVRFILTDFIAEEYSAPTLSFSKGLPQGATVILITADRYWYYKLNEANAALSTSGISLTEFTAMGASNKFVFDTTSESAKSGQTVIYQFIVDFSQAEGGLPFDAANKRLNVNLNFEANFAYSAPKIVADAGLNVESEATFTILANSAETGTKSATLTLTYAQSNGAASIWNGRKSALVLTAKEPTKVPVDLMMMVKIGESTATYRMEADARFIIPLGALTATKSVDITLVSRLFKATAEDIVFTTDWYVSKSNADKSPLNGYKATSCDATFSCQKDPAMSVRIDGKDNKRVYQKGEMLEATITCEGITLGEKTKVIVVVRRKTANGTYELTGIRQELTDISAPVDWSYSLGEMEPNSYQILVAVQVDGANILLVPYYFVIA